MQGEPKEKQGRSPLSRVQVAFLVFVSAAAVISLVGAPNGAVSAMVAGVAGKMAGSTNLEIHDKPQAFGEYSFTDENGKERYLKEFRGKPVVISFWALWCPSCKAEKPGLNKLAGAMKKDGLEVVLLSSDNPKQAAQYLKNHQLSNLKSATDEGDSIFAAMGFPGIPASVVLDKNGREVARALGFVDWTDSEVQKFLRGLLQTETTAER